MKVRLTKRFDFACAHHLPCFAEGHKCRALHGHTMWAELILEGELPERGYLVDFGDIKQIVAPVRAKLDHQYLNEVPGLEVPTCENLAVWIYRQIKPLLDELVSVRVYETQENAAEYWGE